MPTATIEQIEGRLKQLPPEKLVVVLDFVSYLVERTPKSEAFESGPFDYSAALEDYEERLARGEIKWQ